MKKLKLLLVVLLGLLILPFSVLAEEGDEEYYEEENYEEVVDSEEVTSEESNDKVKVYFFRGEGCPHCAEAEEFFESIQGDYGEYFTIVDYETWYNSENAELLQKVAEFREDEVSGVPYIVIGNKSWKGYMTDYNEEIIETITSEYNAKEKYDIMEYVLGDKKSEKESHAADVLAILIMVLVVGGITAGIIVARKRS